MKYDLMLVWRALSFANVKHKGQIDKAGEDYILHCCEVSGYNELAEDGDFEKFKDNEDLCFKVIVGVLHDVLEDTDTLSREITESFGQSVTEHVQMLTRGEDERYMDYINRIKYNPITREIKKRDLLHNLRLDRLDKITHEDIKRCEKYLKALGRLIEMEG